MEKAIYKIFNKNRTFEPYLIIFLLYILPTLLLVTKYITFTARFWTIGASWLTAIAYTFFSKYNFNDLGIRFDNIKISLLFNTKLTLISLPLVYAYSLYIAPDVSYRPIGGGNLLLIIYLLIFVPLQEFFYRSLLFLKLREISNNPLWIIGGSTFVFWSMHFIYDHITMVILALIGGFFWSLIYYHIRNVIGISLSHAIIGGFAYYMGLI